MSEQDHAQAQEAFNRKMTAALNGEKPTLPGRNVLELNGATMVRAIQHYLDTVVCAQPGMMQVVDVTAMRDGGSGNRFHVSIEGRVP